MGNEKRDCYLSSSVLPFTKEIHWPGCHNTLVSQHSCICPWGRQKMLNSKDICHSQNLCSIFNNQIFFICGENRPKLWVFGKISHTSAMAVNSISSPCALRGDCSLENTHGQ